MRYRVRFRVGGRETVPRYGGTFRTMRDAKIRRDYVVGELSVLRVPDLKLLAAVPEQPTVRALAEQWRASRVDVAAGTAATYEVNLKRILPRLGNRAAAELPSRISAAHGCR